MIKISEEFSRTSVESKKGMPFTLNTQRRASAWHEHEMETGHLFSKSQEDSLKVGAGIKPPLELLQTYCPYSSYASNQNEDCESWSHFDLWSLCPLKSV